MKNYYESISALRRYNNMAYGGPFYLEEPFTEEVLRDIQEKLKLCPFFDTTLAVEAINEAY